MIGLGDIVEDCMTDFVIYSSALWAILPAWQINCVCKSSSYQDTTEWPLLPGARNQHFGTNTK